MSTQYTEVIKNVKMLSLTNGFLFDQTVTTAGYSEIRVWVHVFVDNYKTTPVTSSTKLKVRLMHQFSGGSFDYASATFTSSVTSYIDGYTAQRIIGDQTRILCSPENLPAGPWEVSLTVYLVG
jgi:hypothetical protein